MQQNTGDIWGEQYDKKKKEVYHNMHRNFSDVQ